MKILNKNGLNRLVTDTRQYVDNKTRVLTQAEYDALSEAEKNNGTIYFVPDATGSDVTASEVTFDNTGTSMTATNVQAAITELEGASGGGGVGKDLSGQTVKPTSSTEVTAGEGAEIFNDYRDRTYSTGGRVSTGNIASGQYSHAEGINTTASGANSHAEGANTIASGRNCHAEGIYTTAKSNGSGACHAEGFWTEASNALDHAEGDHTIATGGSSHAEGAYTQANGSSSHAEGTQTIANYRSQHVLGEYNIADLISGASNQDKGNYIEIVGNGTGSSARSNARTLDWSGNETLAGKLTLGSAPTNNMDAATKEYVDTAIQTNITAVLNASY